MSEQPSSYSRKIKSFVVRSGRMTVGQRRGWEDYWPTYGIDESEEKIDFSKAFPVERPVVLEIGFGMGGSLFEMARNFADYNYLGVEVHRPGVGALLALAGDAELDNIKLMSCDANWVIDQMLEDESLERVQLFFPDPWHKKRHHKRRLIQAEFVASIARKIKTGGTFHMATDWEPYAEHMLEVMSQAPAYINRAPDNGYIVKPDYRPETKFERRGIKLGHGVWDLVFEKR